MSTLATIEDRPILGTVPFTWEFRPGTSPSTAVADMTPGDAEALTGSGSPTPLKLIISDGPNTPVTIQVYAIQRVPGPNEKIGRVLLADRRWFWNRVHIRAVYNQRRHVGQKRLKSRAAAPVAFHVKDDVAYAPWSMDNGVPWTAESALRNVTDQIADYEAKAGAPGGFTIDGGGILTSVPFENLTLDDPADQALARLLSYLPDFQVTIDAGGGARIYPRVRPGDEAGLFERMGNEKVGGGHIELVSLSRVRPKEIHVLFTPECELRFDFEEGLEIGRRENGEALLADNVLPVPDFELGDWVQGTWITVDQALDEWNKHPLPGFGPLTQAKLRRMMCPIMDVWAAVNFAGDTLVGKDKANWGARIAMLQTHWRRTFRINRRWMDRIARLNAYTVATIDQETGTRGPALAWSDYCALNSQRSRLADIFGGEAQAYALNFQNYPGGDDGNGNGSISAPDVNAAPCRVSVVDPDQGIVRLDWLMDEIRLREMLMPGTISNNPDPRFGRSGAIAFNALTSSFGADAVPQMASGYKAIVLLSAIPAVPNDARQLYRVVVRPQDVPSALGPFDGPLMEVRIGPGLETARIAWVDSKRHEIETLFGLHPGVPNVSDLVINDLPGPNGPQAGSLNQIAQAAAGRIWAGFADRNQGQARFGNVYAPLQGLMDRLGIEVGTSGEVGTTLETGRVGARLNMFSLMPSDVRAFVMRLAQAGK